MAAAEAVAGDRRPVVRCKRDRFVDARRGAIADDRAFKHGDELAFGEIVDLAADLPGAVILDPGIGAADQRQDAGDVRRNGNAHLELGWALPGHGDPNSSAV